MQGVKASQLCVVVFVNGPYHDRPSRYYSVGIVVGGKCGEAIDCHSGYRAEC